MYRIGLLTGSVALPLLLSLAGPGVALAGDPIPDVDVTLKTEGGGEVTAGDITAETTVGDVTTENVTSGEIVDEGDGPGLTKNYNSTRSNRNVAITSDDGSGDVTTNETTNIVIDEEGTKFITDDMETGDISTLMNKGDLINKTVAGDDTGDSINLVSSEAAKPPPPRVEFGEGATGPINITVLSTEVTGNMLKKGHPQNLPELWQMPPDQSIHHNSVSGNNGITTTVLSTGDFSTVNTSTNVSVGSGAP